ncbi:hypothetical protein WA026_004401 [Henosepilachna vigintioctopunctata]|uniref:Uncharacterized protein n=1 Tax=Henosepilachna vigintioctopunctata TaxID=420089 RepID=A0AAW1V8U5_9CUCU
MESTLVKDENLKQNDEGDIEELEEISDDDVENEMDKISMDKNTNLHFSSAVGQIDTFSRDLEASDQKIDAENFMGWTPLMMAVRNGHIDIVKILLEKGADITKKNKLGMNIFSLSVASGKLEMMEMVLLHMLRGGISRNKIQENISPLSLVLLFEKPQLMNWLINQGFDVNSVTPKTSLSPLMFASVIKNTSALDILESRQVNKKHKNYMGLTYQEIKIWKHRGLQYLKERNTFKQNPNIIPDIAPPTIVTTTPDPIPKSKENIIEKHTPSEKKTDIEKGQFEVKLRVPNNTPCSNHAAKEIHKRNNKSLNKLHSRLENLNIEVPVNQVPNANNSVDCDNTQKTVQKQNDLKHLQEYPDEYQAKSSYHHPSNVHYRNYVHVLNSPYGINGVGSPATPVTPIMIVPHYQNVHPTGDVPQHSPMSFVTSPHNIYHNASPHVYYPAQIADMNQFNYDNVQSYNGFYNNSMYYQVVAPAQNVYPFPS